MPAARERPLAHAPAALRRSATLFLTLAIALPAAPRPAGADDLSLSASAASWLERGVRVHRLANGMTFLLFERRQGPVFSAVLRFRAGGMDEEAGQSGLAHLFEHLAFKGTTRIGTRQPEREAELLRRIEEQVALMEQEQGRIPPDPARLQRAQEALAELGDEQRRLSLADEFTQIYVANGSAVLNASTDKDLTTYYVSLPANRLELWCLMESERLRDGVLREFYTERDVVMEERRRQVDSSPFGSLYEALLRAAFGDGPYGLPTVGRMEDLRRLRTPQAREFRRRHYRPENAVAALVGDFKTDEALRLIERYFADWSGEPSAAAGAVPPAVQASGRPTAAALPVQEAPTSVPLHVQVSFPSQAYLLVGFHKPVYPHPDAVAFQVLVDLLGGGRTSHLHRSLVLERQLALDVFAFEGPGERRDNLFIIGAIPQAPHGAAQVEAAILESLAALAAAPVQERELQKVRSRLQASFLRDLASNLGLAQQLSYCQILYGDWRQMMRLLERAGGVTAADIQRAAARYLSADRRVSAELVPSPGAEPAPAAAPVQEPGA